MFVSPRRMNLGRGTTVEDRREFLFIAASYLRQFLQILSLGGSRRVHRGGREAGALERRRERLESGDRTINCSRSSCSRGDADRTPAVLA